jgi:predicted nuclease of restriction endonuclease-like (RecB) superfamily
MPTDKENLIYLKKLNNSTVEAVEGLQDKIGNLLSENILLKEKLINCQHALDINKEIMKNALTEQNAIKDSYSLEIRELKDKIKELEKCQ